MNNETVHEIKIKVRGDRVFDLYVDNAWVVSKGYYENIADEVRKVLKTIDEINR